MLKNIMTSNIYASPAIIIITQVKQLSAHHYCQVQLDGMTKFYVCNRTEDCCNLGCCIYLTVPFYRLWFYWLFAAVLFLICSTGTWWLRFCRREEYSNHVPSYFQNRTNQLHSHPNYTDSVENENLLRFYSANFRTPPPNYYESTVVRYNTNECSIQINDSTAMGRSGKKTYGGLEENKCSFALPPNYESVVRITSSVDGSPICSLVYAGKELVNDVSYSVSNKEVSENISKEEDETEADTKLTESLPILENKKAERLLYSSQLCIT